jgi:hypothetical protein
MRGFMKTLLGDIATLRVTALCLIVAIAILHTPAAILAGAVLPICLLCGAAYLATR